jgi:hypothetical protein
MFVLTINGMVRKLLFRVLIRLQATLFNPLSHTNILAVSDEAFIDGPVVWGLARIKGVN